MNFIQLPLVMTRENSVKTDKLKKMQALETIELLNQYKQKLGKLENFIDVVASEIECYIKGYYDEIPKDCKKLIELKRNLYNKRYFRIEKYKELVDRHPLLKNTKECIRETLQLMELKSLIENTFNKEYEKGRRILWDIWTDEKDMKCCLIHFDENLTIKLEKYLSEKPENHSMKMKKMDGTLLKLYTRATLKPSPFSTLCSVKMLIDNKSNKEYISNNKEKKIQINYVHIFRLWEYVSRVQEVSEQLNYKINFSILKSEEGYTISKLIDVPDENGKIYNGKTMLFRMPESDMLNRLYKLRGKKQCIYSYSELQQRMEIGDEFPKIFKMLLDKKLIYSVERPKENSFDIIGDFLKDLEQWNVIKIPSVCKLAKTLIHVQKQLKVMEQSSDWKERHLLYKAIHDEFEKLYKLYGYEKWCNKNVIYEDYIQRGIGSISRKLSKHEKNVMELICNLNFLFDVNVRTQTEFGNNFYDKYELNKVHTSNSTLISEMIYAGQKYNYLWENNMEVNQQESNVMLNNCLDELKGELLSYIKEKIQQPNKDIIELDYGLLKGIAERIPVEMKQRKRSFDFFLQFENDKVVINNIYTGYLMYFSRFLQYYPQLGEIKEYREYIDTLFNSEEKICDMRITSGFNGNIRPKLSDYELILPNQEEEVDTSIIDYRDCFYIYDFKEQRVKLFHEKIGTFTALSLGSLMPLYLPGITGILHSIFTNSLTFKDLGKMINTANNKVMYMPRICINNVVINRRSWIVNAELFTKNLSKDGNFTNDFCALNQKIEELGIPASVFVKKDVNKEMAEIFLGNSRNQKVDMTARKPQFIHFHNPLLVKLFLNMFAGQDNLIIEEAYPDYVDSDTNVCEAVYEFSVV